MPKAEVEAKNPSVSLSRSDEFCRRLGEIICSARINKSKYGIYSQLIADHQDILSESEKHLFAKNGETLRRLRMSFEQSNACFLYLLISLGEHSTKVLIQKFAQIRIGEEKPTPEGAVKYWTRTFKDLGLIRKSTFSEGKETIYELNDSYPNLVMTLQRVSADRIRLIHQPNEINAFPQFFKDILGR